MENQQTETPSVPEKKTRQLPINKFTIGGAIAVAILCIAIGSASAGTPEPEVRTVTEYETRTVRDDSQDLEIARLEARLEKCVLSTTTSSQAFVDATMAFIKISQGASESNVVKIREATAIIQGIDGASVGQLAAECDSSIGSKLTGLPGQ